MNHKFLVKVSNLIGVVSIVLLVYWVFMFIVVQVFEFKVFRENLTETFTLSIFAILALMFGALMLNIMLNLTRIAEKHNNDMVSETKKVSKLKWVLLGLSFPLIFTLLYCGDLLTAYQKENLLKNSLNTVLESYPEKSKVLFKYQFNKEWINEASNVLNFYCKNEEILYGLGIIMLDSINSEPVFLKFYKDYYHVSDTAPIYKDHFIMWLTKEKKTYLKEVFFNNQKTPLYNHHKGEYELFYPYEFEGKKIVFYIQQYQRYGKLGS